MLGWGHWDLFNDYFSGWSGERRKESFVKRRPEIWCDKRSVAQNNVYDTFGVPAYPAGDCDERSPSSRVSCTFVSGGCRFRFLHSLSEYGMYPSQQSYHSSPQIIQLTDQYSCTVCSLFLSPNLSMKSLWPKITLGKGNPQNIFESSLESSSGTGSKIAASPRQILVSKGLCHFF